MTASGELPVSPGTAPASKVIFTNGGQDPWQWATVRISDDPLLPAMVIQCVGCAHAVDLNTPENSDPAALKDARMKIRAFASSWLQQ